MYFFCTKNFRLTAFSANLTSLKDLHIKHEKKTEFRTLFTCFWLNYKKKEKKNGPWNVYLQKAPVVHILDKCTKFEASSMDIFRSLLWKRKNC